MTTHIVVDIETLGVKERDTVILSIAAVPFSFDHPESFSRLVSKGFYIKVDAMQQLKEGRSKCPGTVEWWKQQSKEAQEREFLPKPTDIPIRQALQELADWVKTTDYDYKNSWVMSRGIAFDMPKIEWQYDNAGIACPFNMWRARDIRTIVDCFTGSTNGQYRMDNEPAEFIKHYCLHDAARDAAAMLEIVEKLK